MLETQEREPLTVCLVALPESSIDNGLIMWPLQSPCDVRLRSYEPHSFFYILIYLYYSFISLYIYIITSFLYIRFVQHVTTFVSFHVCRYIHYKYNVKQMQLFAIPTYTKSVITNTHNNFWKSWREPSAKIQILVHFYILTFLDTFNY